MLSIDPPGVQGVLEVDGNRDRRFTLWCYETAIEATVPDEP